MAVSGSKRNWFSDRVRFTFDVRPQVAFRLSRYSLSYVICARPDLTGTSDGGRPSGSLRKSPSPRIKIYVTRRAFSLDCTVARAYSPLRPSRTHGGIQDYYLAPSLARLRSFNKDSERARYTLRGIIMRMIVGGI